MLKNTEKEKNDLFPETFVRSSYSLTQVNILLVLALAEIGVQFRIILPLES